MASAVVAVAKKNPSIAAVQKKTPNLNHIESKLPRSLHKGRVWAQGRYRSPASKAARKSRGDQQARVEKYLEHVTLGENIYVYNNAQTNQVVYSLNRTLNQHDALSQLTFVGKQSLPATIRKDHWLPFLHIHFPSPSQGLAAFRLLREFRKRHEFAYPLSRITVSGDNPYYAIRTPHNPKDRKKWLEKLENGNLADRNDRKIILMDQKANTIADVAKVLELQERDLTPEGREEVARKAAEREAMVSNREALRRKRRFQAWRLEEESRIEVLQLALDATREKLERASLMREGKRRELLLFARRRSAILHCIGIDIARQKETEALERCKVAEAECVKLKEERDAKVGEDRKLNEEGTTATDEVGSISETRKLEAAEEALKAARVARTNARSVRKARNLGFGKMKVIWKIADEKAALESTALKIAELEKAMLQDKASEEKMSSNRRESTADVTEDTAATQAEEAATPADEAATQAKEAAAQAMEAATQPEQFDEETEQAAYEQLEQWSEDFKIKQPITRNALESAKINEKQWRLKTLELETAVAAKKDGIEAARAKLKMQTSANAMKKEAMKVVVVSEEERIKARVDRRGWYVGDKSEGVRVENGVSKTLWYGAKASEIARMVVGVSRAQWFKAGVDVDNEPLTDDGMPRTETQWRVGREEDVEEDGVGKDKEGKEAEDKRIRLLWACLPDASYAPSWPKSTLHGTLPPLKHYFSEWRFDKQLADEGFVVGDRFRKEWEEKRLRREGYDVGDGEDDLEFGSVKSPENPEKDGEVKKVPDEEDGTRVGWIKKKTGGVFKGVKDRFSRWNRGE